mmetsp:Transcript_26879/g.34893  ORF Transcript_26879/g.34893 Transcript_26879/m.34893 type:complete len:293 (+) Transcript_26879:3191-4069(+)
MVMVVCISTLGPLSYGLGGDRYESNIIKDCFGVDKQDEYLGQGKVDLVIVYGCEPSTIHTIFNNGGGGGGRSSSSSGGGGSSNTSKCISKPTIKMFSLYDREKNYFLRKDRILGVFQVDKYENPKIETNILSEIEIEKTRDQSFNNKIDEYEMKRLSNVTRIDHAVDNMWGESIRSSSAVVMSNHRISQSISGLTRTSYSNSFSSTSTSTNSRKSKLPSFSGLNSYRFKSSSIAEGRIKTSQEGDDMEAANNIEMGTLFSQSSSSNHPSNNHQSNPSNHSNPYNNNQEEDHH